MKAWLAAGAALVLAGGCLFAPAPQPFVRNVEVQPLGLVSTPSALAAEPAPLPAEPGNTPAPDDAIPAPERTDVQGEGDGSMMVSDRVVVHGQQTPRRAPDYSPEQTASMICLAERSGLSVAGARRAHEATLAAAEARSRFEAGLATWREVEDAESRRQDAVRGFMMPVPLLDLFISTIQKKGDLPPPSQDGLVIENADLFIFTERGKRVMAVSGVVRNTTARLRETPPVTLAALDAWEFHLAGQTSLLPFETLAPGEARAFEILFHNPPETTVEVYVHFAPPFTYRSRRDCGSYGAAASATAKAAPDDDGRHTAAELNLLMQYYRRESAEAWLCRDWRARGCGWAQHALHWRDMFLMSEAVDAAWVALRDGNAPEAQASLAEVRRQGESALARAGASAPEIAVALSSATHGRDRDGLYVEVAGQLTNTGDGPQRVDALMLAFVDRLELPLSSLVIPFPRTLEPGDSATFSERVTLTEAVDPDRPRDGRRRRPADDALARAPPPSIPWQVRVGAMAAGRPS